MIGICYRTIQQEGREEKARGRRRKEKADETIVMLNSGDGYLGVHCISLPNKCYV